MAQSPKVAPLNDAIIVAVAQLVDDAQSGSRRDPSHYDLDQQFKRFGLLEGDPKSSGLSVGKAKRVSATLSYALEHNSYAGGALVYGLISCIRGYGGFRSESQNFTGEEAIANLMAAFRMEGHELTRDGEVRQLLLDNLSGSDLSDALAAYVRRAKRGHDDAALVTGTGKDLLEAVGKFILQQRNGGQAVTSNFPTLMGQVFVALGLSTPHSTGVSQDHAKIRVELSMYEMACAINQLRNQQGVGHGRPWLPSVTTHEARFAVEQMGVIAEFLLDMARRLR